MKNSKKAFTMVELLLVLGIIALAVPGILMLKNSFDKTQKRINTDKTINEIKNVIKSTYLSNLEYIENNCVGYTGECSSLTILPTISDDKKYLQFHIKNKKLLEPLKNSSCFIEDKGNDEYDVMCYDGFGKIITFNGINLPSLNSEYISPYKGDYPEIEAQTKFKLYKISFDDLINFSLAKTVQKEVDIGNAIKRFVRTIRLKELANDCSDGGTPVNPANGLASWDDAMVPWIWELVSKQPGVLCSGTTSGDNNTCDCYNLEHNSNYWETDSNFCIINDTNTWSRVINNLGLNNTYRVDGFGNPIIISMLSDSNGNPQSCPPKAPQPHYYDIPQFPKVRIGITYNCQKTYGGQFNQNCEWYSAIDIYGE